MKLEIINTIVGTHSLGKVSAGHIVKAMILNCMGFLTSPLYLFSQFFVGKATEYLIGEGVLSKHLNDDRLGRVLDDLHQKGLTKIFIIIAIAATKKFLLDAKRLHLDSSIFHVHGEYKIPKENEENKSTDVAVIPLSSLSTIQNLQPLFYKAFRNLFILGNIFDIL